MKPRLVRLPLARYLSVAALPLVAGAWLAGVATPAHAEEKFQGPRYTYFDAGYQWADANYAIEQTGGQHEGIVLNGSVDLVNFGPVGIDVFGEFFDGDFTGNTTICNSGQSVFNGDRDSQSIAGGLGAHYRFAETTAIGVRVAYVDITEFQIPNNDCQLVSTDDHGYSAEVMIRSEMSENVEIEAGFRYSELSDSDISNNNVLLGLGYSVTDYLTLRATGVIFDTDTGFELSARLYFGTFLGRDTIF